MPWHLVRMKLFTFKRESPLIDPLAIASLLKSQIQKIPELSLILCGKLSTDSNNFAFPQILAQMLNFPFVTNINHLTYKKREFQMKRECGNGREEILSGTAPLLLSADKGLNQPRYPSLPGIMKAKKKPYHQIPSEESIEEKINLLNLSPPPEKNPPKMISGSPEEQIQELLKFLKEEEKLL